MRPEDNPTISRFGHPSLASWLSALSAVGRTLRDDPLVVNALAIVLAPGSGRTIGLARYLRALCDFERLAVTGAANVVLYAGLRPMRVRVETAVLVGLAFRELLCNALEHAFPLDDTGHVGIHLWPTSGLPGVCACLVVADDGRGFGAEPPAASERGIPLARHLVERCGGALTREPGGLGTVWHATLPATDLDQGEGEQDGRRTRHPAHPRPVFLAHRDRA